MKLLMILMTVMVCSCCSIQYVMVKRLDINSLLERKVFYGDVRDIQVMKSDTGITYKVYFKSRFCQSK